MSVENMYRVTVEADQEGQFFKLPNGWLIDPENADIIIEHDVGQDRYIVQPVTGDDGQPNCKFIFPTNNVG
jgi:hypothetical protein